jgi:predicted lipoprotein with Yx(FWY)xxD motif
MERTTQTRGSNGRARGARLAGAILAIGGVSLSAAAGTAGAATKVVVSAAKSGQLGTILVSGNTLYTLKPSGTPCTTTCLQTWPELLLPKGVTKAKAGAGVTASKLGTVKRAHGALQVTYAGKPLYWFSGDTGAGQVNGNVTDDWGKWSDVVTAKAAVSSSGSGSGGSTAGSGGASF